MAHAFNFIKRKYRNSSNIVLLYSVVFLLLIGIVYLPFFLTEKSLVWKYDGINQHYPALVYFSQLLKGLISGQGFPMMDFKIGMGFDTLTTLHYYVIGDPLNLLSVFVSQKNMELLYGFLILLRLYLAGLSFIYYCRVRKVSGYSAVLGSLLYVFCGYVFFSAVRHPFFINPMIYLPLLFVGVEKLLERNKPFFLTVMVFISTISNFYFFYMLTILVFCYAILRFYLINKEKSVPVTVRYFFITAGKTAFFYVLGILMACILFLPVCKAFLNNGRLESGYEQNLLTYPIRYYGRLIQSFLAANTTGGFFTELTYGAVIPAAVVMIFTRNGYKELKAAFLFLTAGLMLPSFGYVMNGFAYVSNRWEFAYSFLVAFLFAKAFREFEHLEKRELWLMGGGSVFYIVVGLLKPSVYILISCIFLAVSILCLVLLRYKRNKRLLKGILFMVVCCNLGINGYLVNDTRFGNYVKEFINAGEVERSIGSSAVSLLPRILKQDFYRIESYGDGFLNEGLTRNFYDVSGYYSLMDKRVNEYFMGLELASQRAACRFDNLDNRTGLLTLSGVKYVVTSNKRAVPYDYQLVSMLKTEDRTYYLYKNNNYLSLGFTYEAYITRERYESLSSIRKQEVQLRGAVLEEIPEKVSLNSLTGQLGVEGDSFTKHKLRYEYKGNIRPKGDYLIVREKGAKLKVYFKGIADAETYLRIEDIHSKEKDSSAVNLKVKGEQGVSKTITIRNKTNNAYFGKKDYLINLGYSKSAMTYCEITFNLPGRYYLGELEVFTVQSRLYTKLIQERQKTQLKEVSLANNRIRGKIAITKDSLLFLSIPYSIGWKVYVNKEEQKLLPANVMYMALPLNKGTYEIELVYSTPYLKAGAVLSAIGWSFFILLLQKSRWKGYFRRKNLQTGKYQSSILPHKE